LARVPADGPEDYGSWFATPTAFTAQSDHASPLFYASCATIGVVSARRPSVAHRRCGDCTPFTPWRWRAKDWRKGEGRRAPKRASLSRRAVGGSDDEGSRSP
jgi:hypothetical protein